MRTLLNFVAVLPLMAVCGCETTYGPPGEESIGLKSPRVGASAPRSADAELMSVDLTAGQWRIYGAVDDSGHSYDNSTLVFSTQREVGERAQLQGHVDWIRNGGFHQREYFEGHIDLQSGRLILNGTRVDSRPNARTATYEARMSEDGQTLSEGEWYGRDVVPGVWSASLVGGFRRN